MHNRCSRKSVRYIKVNNQVADTSSSAIEEELNSSVGDFEFFVCLTRI